MTKTERALLLALARTAIALNPGNGMVLAELADQVADEDGVAGRRLHEAPADSDALTKEVENEHQ